MKKINLSKILIYLIWITFFKIHLLPNAVNKILKISVVIFSIIYLLKHENKLVIKNKSLILLCFSIFLSSLFSYSDNIISISSLVNGIIYSCYFFLIFLVISNYFKSGKRQIIINSLFNTLLIYSLCSIVTIILFGGNSITETIYFAGNKFVTGYIFMFFLVIFSMKYNNKMKKKISLKIIFIVFLGIFLYLDLAMKGTTVFLGTLLAILILITPSKIISLFQNRLVILSLIIVLGYFPFIMTKIIENETIAYLIVEVFSENLTLNGREKIYSNLMGIFFKRPILGFGYGNDMVTRVVGFGNAQNGLLEIMINFGVFGTISLLLFVYGNLKNHKILDDENKRFLWPLYINLMFLIICSSVEITYGYIFFLTIILINEFSNKKNNFLIMESEQNEK